MLNSFIWYGTKTVHETGLTDTRKQQVSNSSLGAIRTGQSQDTFVLFFRKLFWGKPWRPIQSPNNGRKKMSKRRGISDKVNWSQIWKMGSCAPSWAPKYSINNVKRHKRNEKAKRMAWGHEQVSSATLFSTNSITQSVANNFGFTIF